MVQSDPKLRLPSSDELPDIDCRVLTLLNPPMYSRKKHNDIMPMTTQEQLLPQTNLKDYQNLETQTTSPPTAEELVIAQIESQIRYLTNVDGETTDVLIPVELWQKLINYINSDNASGLAWIDEKEPKAQILADLQESWRQAAAGQTFPVSQLWDDIQA